MSPSPDGAAAAHPPAEAEALRLRQDAAREQNWKRWGPYLSERQWGTVREDYSADGAAWEYFPHEQARSRAYRWGEDGLLGICDRECRLCFALALWNERDPILKERLFGLTNGEGNHGEDVKERYYYIDSTPTHAYLKALYVYPQGPFPYARLLDENRRRSRREPEFELADTGVFADRRYFEVGAEYAKAAPDDILIRLTVDNRGPDPAVLHLLPTWWFRNTWSWDHVPPDPASKPAIERVDATTLRADHATLGRFRLAFEPGSAGTPPPLLLTENETNFARLFGTPNRTPYVKDAFHEYVVHGRRDAVMGTGAGTKAALHYVLSVPPGRPRVVRLRLTAEAAATGSPFDPEFDRVCEARRAEADAFYAARMPARLSAEARAVCRQAYAGLLWSKQFYHLVIRDWLQGDPALPAPPASRRCGRNSDWGHLYNRDVLSMPDKWEYPWYAAWDLAFHMIPFARVDADFAKDQLLLLLREWYMHPSGQIPAYEFAFSDVNPPVHAWACWRVYKMAAPQGRRDLPFLARVFQKLLLNFTWWVNRKDVEGRHVFSGGFLGMDNVGPFDRSKPLPGGGYLQQADGTAWMAFYCATLLSMALELAAHDPVYEDVASKFFEHFVAIADAMNCLDGTGLWDEADGFYYDHLKLDGQSLPLKVRSIVGLLPLLAVEVLDQQAIARLPGFTKRMNWFLANRQDLARQISYLILRQHAADHVHYLLAIPARQRLERVLRYLLDENEFLSPFGIRSLSRIHRDHPAGFRVAGTDYVVDYEPGESSTGMFGGNSNWRGPIWFPVNYLLIEALERYHHFYGDTLQVECPTGSGRSMNLQSVADEVRRRLASLFLRGADGRLPYAGPDGGTIAGTAGPDRYCFHEYFDAETGRGLGASHQTGWTALISECLAACAAKCAADARKG